MKFYNLTDEQLSKELDTDLDNGLSDDKVSVHSKECSNYSYTDYFSVSKLKFNFLKSLVLAFIGSAVYIALSVFTKNVSHLISFAAILGTALLGILIYYVLVSFLNKKIEKDNKKNVFEEIAVIRSGEKRYVNNSDLLYGDVVLLERGNYISFDGRVLESESFLVDETDVTSRSTVEKHSGTIFEENISSSELYNTVFRGSFVVSGSAKVVVTDVGGRVLVSKTQKTKKNSRKFVYKLADLPNLMFFASAVVLIIITVISSILSKDFVSPLSLFAIWASILLSDLIVKHILISITFAFLDFSEKGIYLKNSSVVNRINESDFILFTQDTFFDKSTVITSFSDTKKFYSLNEFGKNNFELFIYSALCSENKASECFKKSVLKLFKKVNIDYSEIESFCPAVSKYYDASSAIELCGRVYDGNNIILAKGSLSKVLDLCSMSTDDISGDILDRLYENSTEILAIAAKSVGVIPSDLSSVNDGFSLVGLIAVERKISKSTVTRLNELNKKGFNSLLLYSGNEISAKCISESVGITSFSLSQLLSSDKSDIHGIHLVYDYKGEDEELVDFIVKSKFKPVFFDITLNADSKLLTVAPPDVKSYDQKSCDVVCDYDFEKIYYFLNKTTIVFSAINQLYEAIFTFVCVYAVCGLLFSVLFKDHLFNPAMLGVFGFVLIPLLSLFSLLYKKQPGVCNVKNISKSPIQFANLAHGIIVALCLIVLSSVSGILLSPGVVSAMVLIAFLTYIPNWCFDDKLLSYRNLLVLIPSVFFSLIFMTPLASAFGCSGFSFVCFIISLIFGILMRLLVNVADKLFKF